MEEKKKIENHFQGTTNVTGFFFCKEQQELHDSISKENREKIDSLLAQNPDQVNIFTYDARIKLWITPLSLAVKTKKIPLIEKLLDVSDLIKESRIHYYNEDIYFFSPLFFTFGAPGNEFSSPIAEMLLQKDPNGFFFRSTNNENILHLSAGTKNERALSFFLEANSEGAKDKTKKTNEIPLHHAVINRNANNISDLLKANSKGLNAKDHNGNTPMHLAASIGDLNILRAHSLVFRPESSPPVLLTFWRSLVLNVLFNNI
jgi:ankyrin repeat protein